MTYSIQHETRSIAPAAPPLFQADEQGGYGELAAATYVDEFIPIPYDEGPVVPASHMSFDVTVQRGADTQGQLERMLGQIKNQMPADKFVIQEINVRGLVFTGGNPADLGHSRALALRNEDYVHHFLALAELRPELKRRSGRHVPAAQAQSDTQHNAVRVDVVYRRRSEDEGGLAQGRAAKASRCAKAAGTVPDAYPTQGGSRAVQMAPAVTVPVSKILPYGMWPAWIPLPEDAAPSEDKVWLRRCPTRPRA
ncbi:hypothetical protein [Bordetella sp. LUAb4]|uniref:hypothetical protein n=1 Tax=Bordetella sp. LUAb4 TaxID=2843195 RepID=UPI001E2E3C9F|nr:hypothetical protein [Bordetella sp. LUAb4]